MNETQYLTCNNQNCPNLGINLLWTNPDEWGQCCEDQAKRFNEATSKQGYNPTEFYKSTYDELDELLAQLETDRADLPTVDLVAAGYDWTCPACGHEHFTTEFYDQVVTCVNCDARYNAMIAHPEM